MKCKCCGCEKIYKNGKRNGTQCYLCKDCGHQFTSEFGRHNVYDEHMAVALYSIGLSFRIIGKLLGYHNTTILIWIRNYCKRNYKKPKPQGEILIELDEMWHFIQSKKNNCGFGKPTVALLDNLLIGKLDRVTAKHSKNFTTG